MRSWLGVVGLLLSGCAHLKAECATHGGPTWHELRSAHFVVRSNLELEAARTATQNLERSRAALLPSFPGAAQSVQPLDVLMLHNALELEDLVALPVQGAIDQDWRGTLVLLAADAYAFEANTEVFLLLHELTHYFSAFSFLRQSRWLGEGFASYFETISIDPVLSTALRGKANLPRLKTLRRWGIIPIEQLWAWEKPGGPNLQAHRYASAWLWVHFLFNRHEREFEGFLDRLKRGEEPRRAWDAAFSALGPAELAKEAETYLHEGTITTQFYELNAVRTEVSVRVLPDAEVHAALARAAALAHQWERARREALAAVKLGPDNPQALEEEVVSQRDRALRTAGARRLTATDPKSATGWLLLALGLEEGEAERTQALERAVELDPGQVIALSELARSRSRAGLHVEAMTLAEKAMAAAPHDVRVVAVGAEVLAGSGQCALAAVTQRRAIERMSHRAPVAFRARMEEALSRYERCEAK